MGWPIGDGIATISPTRPRRRRRPSRMRSWRCAPCHPGAPRRSARARGARPAGLDGTCAQRAPWQLRDGRRVGVGNGVSLMVRAGPVHAGHAGPWREAARRLHWECWTRCCPAPVAVGTSTAISLLDLALRASSKPPHLVESIASPRIRARRLSGWGGGRAPRRRSGGAVRPCHG